MDAVLHEAATTQLGPAPGEAPSPAQAAVLANPTLHLALYHPVIPQNAGNIGRICIGIRAQLHLIAPLGFSLDDKLLRRAGLDYWPDLVWRVHANDDAFLAWLGTREPWLVTKFGRLRADRAAYGRGDVLLLGNENHGLPAAWRERWAPRCIALPMLGPIRSFNLANAAAMVAGYAVVATGAAEDWQPAS
jgi:tRNA (cytidine(34)-2'-O)-methyltransferase